MLYCNVIFQCHNYGFFQVPVFQVPFFFRYRSFSDRYLILKFTTYIQKIHFVLVFNQIQEVPFFYIPVAPRPVLNFKIYNTTGTLKKTYQKNCRVPPPLSGLPGTSANLIQFMVWKMTHVSKLRRKIEGRKKILKIRDPLYVWKIYRSLE